MKAKINVKRLSVFSIILCTIILIIILIITNMLKESKCYTFKLDNIENISRIASQKSNTETKIEITSKEIVEDVINYITKEEKTTKKASVSDIPQVEEYYIVNFKGTEQVMYLYTKSDKYYIERPYDGIYEITQEEYNNILKYLYLN